MPVMSECRSMLLSLSNYQAYKFTLPDSLSSISTESSDFNKAVYFRCNNGTTQSVSLAIVCEDHGSKYACSHANQEGFDIKKDDKGLNMLTGQEVDRTVVYFKMLEVYEVECLNPPKQPEIPEPEAK
jgi:hypothetical protein